MQRALLVQRALLRRRVAAMRVAASAGTERIALDGSIRLGGGFSSAPGAAAAPEPRAAAAAPRRPGPPIVPPEARALPGRALERLVDFVADHHPPPLVITGAGVSTEAGLPDYRGPGGAYSLGFRPMTHQQFLASDGNRRRYWARAFAGWPSFSDAEPAAAHVALARLQRRGWVGDIVTQNVDRLHTRAGARDVIELHGSTHDVVCLECGAVSPRAPLQRAMEALNPAAAAAARERRRAGARSSSPVSSPYVSAAAAVRATPGLEQRREQQPLQQRPDGDAEVDGGAGPFLVPPCPACGAGGSHDHRSSDADAAPPPVVLKPNVVFFGDGVPRERADRALALAATAGAVLVVGSSLRVWSAFRLVKAAAERKTPIAILNFGPTRADEQLAPGSVTLRIDGAMAGDVLARLERHPALQLPAAAAARG